MEKKNIKNIILSVLFWGALWGIVEASLGTILHLPAFEGTGLYFSSSVIVIPIAYCLMANCYKKTNAFYAVYLMGIVAGLIKLSVAFIIGFTVYVYHPAIYIVMEALAMGSALAVFKPKNVLSLKTFGAFVMANTIYQFGYLLFRLANGSNAFASMEAWKASGEKYLFTVNGLALLYSFAIGSIAYGVSQLFAKLNVKASFDINKIVYSPITAMVALTLALTLTITLAAVA